MGRLFRPGKRHDHLVHSKSHLPNVYFVLGTECAKSSLREYGAVNTLLTVVVVVFKPWSVITRSCIY